MAAIRSLYKYAVEPLVMIILGPAACNNNVSFTERYKYCTQRLLDILVLYAVGLVWRFQVPLLVAHVSWTLV